MSMMMMNSKSYIVTFNDLERPVTPISRSRHYLTLYISETAKHTAIVAIEGE